MEELLEKIDSLPEREERSSSEKEVYKIGCLMRGLINCRVCGQAVNMGYMLIVNPTTKEETILTYTGLHILRNHGKLEYELDLDRTPLERIKEVLGD